MSWVDWPCGQFTIIGAEPKGRVIPSAVMWNDHLAECNSMACALAADQAKLESMDAFDKGRAP